MVLFVICCLLPAFAVSLATTASIRSRAEGWGLVDNPNARKMHRRPTPLGGGIGIWAGVVLPVAMAQLLITLPAAREFVAQWLPAEISVHLDGFVARSAQMWMILAAGTVLSIMGLVDDLRNLPWQPRLAIQFLVAAGLVWSGVSASVFVANPLPGQLLTIVWLMVLINAFNFLDNMDGLSSGVALVGAGMFAIVMLTSVGEPRWLVGGVMLVLAGSLAGFLVFNWSPASIFMGDSGSYFIGLLMGSMTVVGTFYNNQSGRHVILAPLLILAVPLYDFASVLLIRIREGRSPFHADKKHFSHRLVEIGIRPSRAVLTIHLATLTTGLAAVLLYEVQGWRGALLLVGLVCCVLAIIAILETAGRVAARRQDDGRLSEPGDS